MRRYFETPNLVLRGWTRADIAELARLNADERVMEFFLKKLSLSETLAFYDRIQEEFETSGFGLYAVEEKLNHAFVGYVGLHRISPGLDFAPAVEIAWRLLPEYWGRGYATEAAAACLEYAEKELKLSGIVSFTSLPNKRSERVMQKIGMVRIGEFDHPAVATDHPLRRHVLYKTPQ